MRVQSPRRVRHDQRVANGSGQVSDVVKALGVVVGMLAGVVTLLYAAGGGALTLRLFLYKLPSLNVVAQLPREVLISVALIQIVLPAVAAAALYALVRLLLGRTAPSPRRLIDQWDEQSWRSWSARVGVSAVLAIAATLLGASPALARWDSDSLRRLGWVLTVVFVLNVVVMLVALRLRAEVATRGNGVWNTPSSGGSMTLIVALAALPACFIFAGTFRLLDVRVCTTNSTRTGLLIGETSDRIYLGETRKYLWEQTTVPPTLRVMSIPHTEVKEVLIGSKPSKNSC